MSSKNQTIWELADAVEAEMRKLGLWGDKKEPAAPQGAFGTGTMTFEEWLQLVFLPNLRTAASAGKFPTRSNVAVAALRNLDGVPGVEGLIELLSRIDEIVERQEPSSS